MATLLLAEHDNASLKDSTNKALTAAKAIGADVHILVAGKDCKAVAEACAKLDGVKQVLLADAALYEHRVDLVRHLIHLHAAFGKEDEQGHFAFRICESRSCRNIADLPSHRL